MNVIQPSEDYVRRVSIALEKEISLPSPPDSIAGRHTPWASVWISISMQFVIGVQISIYYMSMWPYLNGLDNKVTLDFLGWVVAACSVGCSVANPIFGFWNQKTLSVTYPTVVGLLFAACGQTLYGLLPVFSSNQQWIMIGARFITGIGAGTLSVLRAYVATASIAEDRLRAISFGTAGFVLGLSLGPVLQAAFTPVGENGFKIGSVIFNMYTLPAFSMAAFSIASCVFLVLFFKEQYSGIISDEEMDEEPYRVIPQYDMIPALICIYLWVVCSMVSTNIEVISTPLSTAMYDWKDSKSVLYNGILEACACLVSVAINFVIGMTRIGKIEKRTQILFGLFVFLAYHTCNYPWSFYPGPLDYIPAGNTSAQIGGCEADYKWCATSVRVPLPLYIFTYVFFFGIAFPFIGSPSSTLFSEILGPRRQGFMQGMYSFGGSVAQFVAPVLSTYLFQHSGYRWVMLTQIMTLSLATALMVVFYKRLVPLKMKPKVGKSAKYKEGVFYTM